MCRFRIMKIDLAGIILKILIIFTMQAVVIIFLKMGFLFLRENLTGREDRIQLQEVIHPTLGLLELLLLPTGIKPILLLLLALRE